MKKVVENKGQLRLKAFLYLLTEDMTVGSIESIIQRINIAEANGENEIVFSNKYILDYVNDLIYRLIHFDDKRVGN